MSMLACGLACRTSSVQGASEHKLSEAAHDCKMTSNLALRPLPNELENLAMMEVI